VPHAGPVITAAVGTALVVVLATRVRREGVGALACGLAAGVAMGIAAVLISAALKVLSERGLLPLLTNPSLWAAVVAAVAAQYASQQAFARGSLSLSLPALTVVDPLAAVPAARLLLGERLAPGHAATWLPAAAVAALGVVLLARTGQGCRRPLGRRRPRAPVAAAREIEH
jgi:drug/metabolite transporter (DMT)-like permease